MSEPYDGATPPPERHSNKVLVTWNGAHVPVNYLEPLSKLFKRRDPHPFQLLKVSILANGQDGRCLFASLDGKTLVCVDGHDTLRAIAELRNEGHLIEIAWDFYEPKATTPETKLLELMALIIRRKNLQTAIVIDDGAKKRAIRAYLVSCYAQGFFPNDSWVAEDVGCSRTWVTNVRAEAVRLGKLIAVAEYAIRGGGTRTVKTERETFGGGKTEKTEREAFGGGKHVPVPVSIPINPNTPKTKLGDEIIAEEEAAAEARARARAEAQADELIANPPGLPAVIANPAGFPAVIDVPFVDVTPPGVEEPFPDDEGFPPEVLEVLEHLDSILEELQTWELSPEAIKELKVHAEPIVKCLEPFDAEATGQDDGSDVGPSKDVDQNLEAVYEWNASQEDDLPKEDLPWLYHGGFIKVEPGVEAASSNRVELVDKDQFLTLLRKKFAPIVKKLGADPMAFENAVELVFNTEAVLQAEADVTKRKAGKKKTEKP
jgi:hypothetical protein